MSDQSKQTQIDVLGDNILVPLVPSVGVEILQDDIPADVNTPPVNGIPMPSFMWITAFFDGSITVRPQLVVDNGKSYQQLVVFSYSGQERLFKGRRIVATGTDYFGRTINSTPIGVAPTTELASVVISGGAR